MRPWFDALSEILARRKELLPFTAILLIALNLILQFMLPAGGSGPIFLCAWDALLQSSD
jgi:hypothetical protein